MSIVPYINADDEESFGGDRPASVRSIYQDVIENIDLGIIVLNLGDQTILLKNRAVRQNRNLSQKLSEYHAIVSSLDLGFDQPSSGPEKPRSRELRIDDKIYGYTGYQISNGCLCIFILDITDKVRLQSIAEAVNTMNNIGYIFSGIRHEVGNPINSIKTTLTVLQQNIQTFDIDTHTKYLERARNEVERIEYLLHSLKNFNMHESLTLADLLVDPFMKDFLLLISRDFQRKGIAIDIDIHPRVKSICADPRALQQVLLNLVTNSADALSEVKNPEVSIQVLKQGKTTKIRIKDNGCGMSYDEHKNLFTPFCTTKPHGTGLGMVICRKMLAKMRSTICVESTKSEGTTVELSFPENPGSTP